MQTYTEAQVRQLLASLGSVEHDNQGQLVIYTGVYRWTDRSYHDCPDPELENDLTDA